MISQPACIHVSDLVKGAAACVQWEKVEGADGYELHCIYRGGFALPGLEWQELDALDVQWERVDTHTLTWDQMETVPMRLEIYRAGATERILHDEIVHLEQALFLPLETQAAFFQVRALMGDAGTAFATAGQWHTVKLPEHPRCIHAPELIVETPSAIVWDAPDGASGYVRERRLNARPGTIPETYYGLRWRQLRESACPIGSLRARRRSWNQLMRLGGKEPVEGYDTFTTVDSGALYPADHIHVGLRWRDIHYQSESFGEIASQASSWRAVAAMGDEVAHIGCDDIVPDGAESAVYRVKAVADGVESAYRYSPAIPVLYHARKSDRLELDVVQGETMFVQIISRRVKLFPETVAVSCDPQVLRLDRLDSDWGVLSRGDSSVLHCTTDPLGKRYTGQSAFLTFTALQTARTILKLS